MHLHFGDVIQAWNLFVTVVIYKSTINIYQSILSADSLFASVLLKAGVNTTGILTSMVMFNMHSGVSVCAQIFPLV